jgi:hypothetical protein
MDIEQVVKEKEQLEDDIKKLVFVYENRTHTRVTGINLQVISSPHPTFFHKYIKVGLSVRAIVEI